MNIAKAQPELKTLLNRFSGKKVLVIGDVGVDRYTVGSVDRISPEAPVPIVRVTEEYLKLGLAANVADNIRVLQGTPYLTGVVGRDRFAEDFSMLLKQSDISDSELIVDAQRPTILKDRVVSERQQLLRIDHETDREMSKETRDQVLHRAEKLLGKVDAVIVEDYSKGLLSSALIHQLAASAEKRGIPLLADPNEKTPVEAYRGVTVLTPNRSEAEALAGRKMRWDPAHFNQDLNEVGRILLDKTQAKHIVITLGKDGMALFGRDGSGEAQVIPTWAREVYDVSGAGDTVIAVLALALSAGATLEQAAILANLAAGVEVGKRGTATVSCDEILQAMDWVLGV